MFRTPLVTRGRADHHPTETPQFFTDFSRWGITFTTTIPLIHRLDELASYHTQT